MAELSRRAFLQKSSVAMVGGATVIGALANEIQPASAREPAHAGRVETSEPVVAFVRNGRRGEVSIMVGDRETVRHDPDLVRRLLRAAK